MATHGWRSDHSVEDWLFAEGEQFDFYQAVTLLQGLRPEAAPVGESADPDAEAIRFRSSPKLKFPAGEVEGIERGEDGRAEMTVNFLGLGGPQGPLPRPYVELLLERMSHHDYALRDFLDIFHHRLVSLLYRVRAHSRVGLESHPPDQDPISHYLYAFLGLLTGGQRGRMRVKDRSLLHYTGLLSHQARSLAGLECILAEHFAVPVKGRSFTGRWYPLEESQLTVIGRDGRNNRLGKGTILGFRVFDLMGHFEVRLGPLSLARFQDFLPTGTAFLPLVDLTRFYVGPELEFDVVLELQAADVPDSRLNGESGPRAAWTSWLHGARPAEADAAAGKPAAPRTVEVRLTAPTLPPELKRLRVRLFADLTVDELSSVASRMREHNFPKGMVVVNQGDQGRSLFLVVRGAVRVFRRGADGHEITLSTIRRGEFFGEISLLDGTPRSASVVAAEDSQILELSREDLEELWAIHPHMRDVLDRYAESRRSGR